MKKMILCLCLFIFSSETWAQSTNSSFMGTRKSVATVMFAGLGGAVVGLSTLSFYGKPEEHVSNIWTGLALGVIGGVVYVSVDNQRYSRWEMPEFAPPNNPHQVRPVRLQPLQYGWNF